MDAPDEDARLMLAFCAGDGAAFDALFRRWAAPLLRYLERMLRDAAAAEELVQEVFLRVHGARERYQPQARFSTWLYRIATNLALNELRRPRRREPHASVDEPGGPALAADGAGAGGRARRAARSRRASSRSSRGCPSASAPRSASAPSRASRTRRWPRRSRSRKRP